MERIEPLTFYGNEGRRPIIISGPCSAESREQVICTAEGLSKAGIQIYRAGLWKPRTQPGNFEGVGAAGLPWLKEVKDRFGMKVATEVATPAHVKAALNGGIDILWIGARTTANPFAVQEIADTIKECGASSTISLLVKNPVNPDLELWIGAIQRLVNSGIRKIGAVHRGFSVYGNHFYRNPPEWRLPIEMRLRYPNLTLLCDPSHIGGKRELIGEISQQAIDMSFDGLMIESHCNPEAALSDGRQQLTPQELGEMLKSLTIRRGKEATEALTLLRSELDQIDSELLELIGKRMEISRKIGAYKRRRGMTIVQPDRYNDVMNSRIEEGTRLGISESFLRKIMLSIHDESVREQLTKGE